MPRSNLLRRRGSRPQIVNESDASVATEILYGVVTELQASSRGVPLRSCIRRASLKLFEDVVALTPFADERVWNAALDAAMADYGACPSVPVPVMEILLGASSEHRPMLLLLPPCLAALASIKSEMEQQTIVAATRALDRFPLLAAAVKERLQQLLEEVVAECREKLAEFIQEKESFFIDIGWPATFVYPTVPLGVRVAGSDRWDGASKPVGPSQGPSTEGTRLVGQDEWEPTTGLEELKRYYGGVQEAAIKATPEKVHRWCVRAFEAQVAARLCSLDLRSSDADLLRDSKPSSSQAQAGETLLL